MARPRLVKAGVTLRDQINQKWVHRDRKSDGWIGDSNHQARPSDHNPDKNGWVHAIDIDEDFLGDGKGQRVAAEFADQLIQYAREGKDGGRLKYVVYENRIASGTYSDKYWVWRTGNWGHTHHIHVSFTSKAEEDGRKFDLPIFSDNPIKPEPPKPPAGQLWDGIIPQYNNVILAMNDSETKNMAAYRLACRLADMGFFNGVPVLYEQGYPWKAVEAWQKSQGYKVQPPGRYGPKAHDKIFGIK